METVLIDDDVKARQRLLSRELVDSGALDEIFARIDSGELELSVSAGGLIPAMIQAVLERGLRAELSDHLGYEKGDVSASGFDNSRNGSFLKTLASEVGDITIQVPRDRNGTFTPRLVPKGVRRLGGLEDMIISLYAGGMTVREIQHHLARSVGSELSVETISKITDEVLDEVYAWQARPLEEFYPVMFLDAIVLKIRDGAQVKNKAAHIAVGVDMEGVKHVLGIWIAEKEGAAFWSSVCANLANRGVKDVLIVATDGLTGFADAVESTWPNSIVQTCVVHLIRASMRFVSYKDRKAVVAGLKPIYTAADEAAAGLALDEFETDWGKKYPRAVATWQNAWDRFIPFLAFPPELRRVIYTTNTIESLNYQLRKIVKTRGHFPNDQAAVKLLWLAICNIEDRRAIQREKEAKKPRKDRKTSPRLVEGAKITYWKKALSQLATAYPDRMEQHL